MRKLLLTTAIFFASLGFVFSQTFSNPPCVIATANTDTGLITPYFDSVACIEQGLPFSASVQLAMPATFNGLIVLDSLVIDTILGLPAGISYKQNPASGVYYADSNGCIAFEGTSNADSAAYPLQFIGYAVVSTQNSGTQTLSFTQLKQFQDNPVPSYQLNIIYPGDSCHPQSAVGIKNVIQSSQLNVYPNPTTGTLNVELNTDKALSGEMMVYDVTGRSVYARSVSSSGLYRTILDLSAYAKGLYLLQLKTSEGVVSKRIAVQ